jgi:hypothetical protein
VFSPDGRRLAFISGADGSTNVFVMDLETEEVTQRTFIQDGRQISDPAWHPSGEWIYFGLLADEGRDLYRVGARDGEMEVALATEADERSPAFDAAGAYLYFSSDRSGIFNLYRVPVAALDDAGRAGAGASAGTSAETKLERLTNVIGGAFMPDVGPTGALAYSHYRWDGYKIAVVEAPQHLPEAARLAPYAPPPVLGKREPEGPALAFAWGDLNAFNDTDLRPIADEAVEAVRTEGNYVLHGASPVADESREVTAYKNVFTSFSFFPVLRLDQYVSRRRSVADVRLKDRTFGEALWRNTKAGVYVNSREVFNDLTMLGGLMLGPGSRELESVGDFFSPSNLLKLERDAFIQFEYNKGLGLLPRRWSPQFSIELFNIRRNVENGLSIEEFPCTACFPDTTLADISYNLWELDVAARSKVNRALLLEVGYRYSPYRVTTERFFSKELDLTIPESSSRYFIGRAYRFKAYFEAPHPYRNDDVLPVGLKADATYEFEPGRLLDRFEVEDGLLNPVFERFKNHRLTVDARYGLRLPGPSGRTHGLTLRALASTVLGGEVDDFFNEYVGGLIGARGYPFYALGGNEALWFQAAYTFPLLPAIHRQVGFLYLDKLYLRLYGDAALAWSGAWPGLGETRKDAGAELRLAIGSFYLLPTAVFVSATYGFDAFDFELDDGFLTPDGSDTVRYGQDLLWHMGVLFDFDL